jgi:hypothetical protein
VVVHVDVKEGIDGDHFAAHVVRPLQDLRAYTSEEGVGGPSTQDHYFGRGDVIDEKGHGRARADGLVPNLVRVESEGCFSTEGGACGAEDLEDAGVGDETRFPFVGDGVDGSRTSGAGKCAQDSLDLGSASEDWAKLWVVRASLGPGVHFCSVLLIYEGDRDAFGFGEQVRIGVSNHSVGGRPKDEAVKVDALCLAQRRWLRVLAGAHGKEKGADH